MSPKYTTSDPYQRPPIQEPHAPNQWTERFPDHDVDIQTAWERGLPALAPLKDGEAFRLYPPENALLILRDGLLRTAIPANDTLVLPEEDLERCQQCGNAHEPLDTDETCPWCDATLKAGRSTGPITIRRGR
jgi:hypothetical protein